MIFWMVNFCLQSYTSCLIYPIFTWKEKFGFGLRNTTPAKCVLIKWRAMGPSRPSRLWWRKKSTTAPPQTSCPGNNNNNNNNNNFNNISVFFACIGCLVCNWSAKLKSNCRLYFYSCNFSTLGPLPPARIRSCDKPTYFFILVTVCCSLLLFGWKIFYPKVVCHVLWQGDILWHGEGSHPRGPGTSGLQLQEALGLHR